MTAREAGRRDAGKLFAGVRRHCESGRVVLLGAGASWTEARGIAQGYAQALVDVGWEAECDLDEIGEAGGTVLRAPSSAGPPDAWEFVVMRYERALAAT